MRATFNCNVCEIVVNEEDEVEAGDKLAVVEAMKMQTPIISLVSGTVVEINAKVVNTDENFLDCLNECANNLVE